MANNYEMETLNGNIWFASKETTEGEMLVHHAKTVNEWEDTEGAVHLVNEDAPLPVADADVLAKLVEVLAKLADVDITTLPALAAGTNAIGKLAANDGVDIGDVDVTSAVLVDVEGTPTAVSAANPMPSQLNQLDTEGDPQAISPSAPLSVVVHQNDPLGNPHYVTSENPLYVMLNQIDGVGDPQPISPNAPLVTADADVLAKLVEVLAKLADVEVSSAVRVNVEGTPTAVSSAYPMPVLNIAPLIYLDENYESAAASAATPLPVADADVLAKLVEVLAKLADVDITTLPATPAGTNLIGKVGIDQATANANEVVTKSGSVSADSGPAWASVRGVSGAAVVSADATSATAVTDAPTGGQKLVITDIIFSSDTAINLLFEEESSGTDVFKVFVPANGSGQITPRGKCKLATADKKLTVKASAAGNIAVTVLYYSEA